MSDSSVALGSTGATNATINSVGISYSGICQHRLPCGYCQLRNMMCPVSTCTIASPCKPWWEQVYCTTDTSDKTTTASISGESK